MRKLTWIGVLLSAWIAACEDTQDMEEVAFEPLPERPTFGVVASDDVASITLLDADGEIIARDWVTSGSTPPGLVMALSGDVVLPTQPTDPEALPILDRKNTDVLTRILTPEGELVGQVRTHDASLIDGDAAAFSSNPHDYVYLDDETALVSRHSSNVDSDAPEINQGNDLIFVDPASMERTGERIDLSRFNATGQRKIEDSDETEEVTVYARPSKMVKVGAHVAVALTLLSDGFDAASEGRLAIVDPDSGEVEAVELPDMANCGNVAPLPGADDKVVVSCQGFADPYDDQDQLRASAGIAIVHVDEDGTGSIETLWHASEHPDAPITAVAVTPLGGTRVIAASYGSYAEDRPDEAHLLDLEDGTQEKLFETEGPYELLSPGAYDPDSGMLIMADRHPRILRFQVEGDEVTELDPLHLGDEGDLTVAGVYLLKR